MKKKDKKKKVLVISDMHMPYQHPDAFDFLRDKMKEVKPDVVMCIGDLVDFHSFGRFDKLPDAHSASEELRLVQDGVATLEKILGEKCEKLGCVGNHEYRLNKDLARANIPQSLHPELKKAIGLSEDWKWSSHHIVDGVFYKHGTFVHKTMRKSAAGLQGGMPCVYGHLHDVFNIFSEQDWVGQFFIVSVGCLVDRRSPVFTYAREYNRRPALGTAAIIGGAPMLLRMDDESIDKTRFDSEEEADPIRKAMIDAAKVTIRFHEDALSARPADLPNSEHFRRMDARRKERYARRMM